MAAEYAWLPLIPPNLQPSNGNNQFTYGVNFAAGGAGALVGTFSGMVFIRTYYFKNIFVVVDVLTCYLFFKTTFSPLKVINLRTQLNNFKEVEKMLRFKLGDAEGKKVISRAVYLFHIGLNDYLYPFTTNSSIFQSISKEKYVDFVVGNMTDVFEVKYIEIDLKNIICTCD